MYVDKKLDGLAGRPDPLPAQPHRPGKEDTFVLDFVNEAEDIQEAFKPYYEKTEIEERVDPNLVYTLKTQAGRFPDLLAAGGRGLRQGLLQAPDKQREADKGLLHKCIDPAVGRFKGEPEERQVDFRHQLGTFLRLYAFLSQLVNYGDPDLEKLYAFGRLLITKLKIDDGGGPLIIDDEVKLSYYRLTKTHEGSASLATGETATVTGPTDVGTGRPREEDKARLSEIVDVLNERFGTEFTKEDQLFFDQIVGDLKKDERPR